MLGFFAIIAQIVPTEIVVLFAPLVIFAAAELVKWLLPKLPGWSIVSLIVPLLSLISAWLITAVVPGSTFWPTVLFGLLAVFVNELIRQLKQLFA
jgi:hypothetical protein